MHGRAVLDTNVIVAAMHSRHPNSPNTEILHRWQHREFVFLFSLDTLAEYAEKLFDRGIPDSDVAAFIESLAQIGEAVPIVFFHFRHYPVDPDDVMFLLCAINGGATHLVGYDAHLLSLQPFYAGEFSISEPLPFLEHLREATSME